MNDRASRTLDLCTQYLNEYGWSVYPLFSMTPDGCECGGGPRCSPGKHPNFHLAPNGVKNATNYIEEVEMWLDEYPNMNVAVATGKVSNIVVIDVDWEKGGDLSSTSIFDRMFPHIPGTHRAPTQFTRRSATGGGGYHLFYQYPGFPVRNISSSKKLGTGIDVRGDGGSAILPPSIHQSGALYEWDNPELPIQPMPEWMQVRIKYVEPPSVEPLSFSRGANAYSGKRGPIREPGRNSELTRIAGGIHKEGASNSELRAQLHKINREACVPPLPQMEVDMIANSISNYPR